MVGLFGWTKNNDGSWEKTIWLWKWPFCQAKHYMHALQSHFRHRPLLVLLIVNWSLWPAASIFIGVRRIVCFFFYLLLRSPITDHVQGLSVVVVSLNNIQENALNIVRDCWQFTVLSSLITFIILLKFHSEAKNSYFFSDYAGNKTL